jgi:ArsR family transcriptional regulator, cadmium/lead-responsive transcriptional repressor
LSDPGPVFAALADPTRREIIGALLRDGSTSVPALTAELPITRQAVAKHLATLDDAGLVQRAPGPGREVRYGLRPGALTPARSWIDETEAAWDARLQRLKRAVEDHRKA